jgi:NADPH-dependent curcumin reductase CurA
MNRQIILAARPEGLPKPSDFRFVEVPVSELTEGQFLVKTNYLS